MYKSAIHWFRKGLRLHDNPALLEACKSSTTVYPLFILDPIFANPDKVGVNRYAFLLQSLEDLDRSLREFGSRLYVVKGRPEDKLPILFNHWDVQLLTFEVDTEPYALERDSRICDAAKKCDVAISCHVSHTLRDMADYKVVFKGKIPTSYAAFTKVFDSMPPVQEPLPAPHEIPSAHHDTSPVSEVWCESVPSLSEMGYEELAQPLRFPGGESEALSRLSKTITSRPDWVFTFSKPNTAPTAIDPPSTTVLSPYLKFGCLSVRYILSEITKACKVAEKCHTTAKGSNQNRKCTQPPVSLKGQILWREFFYSTAAMTPHFDRMEGNSSCRQIPWERDTSLIDAWKFGRTGYPFIDAIMTQLRTEGWIHHLARHAAACFLTRGDLWQHWEEGVKVFDLYLLDADWALNNANWQWLSCSNFFYQYFRCYSPVAFGKHTDKNGSYIRHWLPKLSRMPEKYIYEPWKAPLSVQRSSGCVIGVDYPERIVIHEDVSKANMTKMKIAYSLATAGISPSGTGINDRHNAPTSAKRSAEPAANSSRSVGNSKRIDSFFSKRRRQNSEEEEEE